MQFTRIVTLGLCAAITYGICHDQVTARVCVEYFTIGHPTVIQSESPTLLALTWGVLATWWVGLPLGILLALGARAGRRPKLVARELLRPVGILLLAMACLALVSGTLGYLLARGGAISLLPGMAARIPPESHAPFLADLWAHTASYLAGFVGGLALVILTFRRRGACTMRSNRPLEQSAPGC